MKWRSMMIGSGALGKLGLLKMSRATVNSQFYVPPKDDCHQLTFMQWPVNRRAHPDPVFLDMAQQTIADIAKAINEFEPVVMLCAAEGHAEAHAKLSEKVELWDISTEDFCCGACADQSA